MRSPKRAVAAALLSLVALAPAAPALARPAAGLAGADVVIFDTDDPSAILDRREITGLNPTESVTGIDVRPADGKLYAITVENTGASHSGRLMTLDPGTGAATQVGAGPFSTSLTPGAEYGFDFNPVADQARVVSTQQQNLRVNPDTAAPVIDAPLTAPVSAVAYDQSHPGSTATTLWGINPTANTLVRIGGFNGSPSPNQGAVTTVGALGVDVEPRAGFDIAPDGPALVTAGTGAPAIFSLYGVNFATGALTKVGDFPEQVDDLAVLPPQSIQFDTRTPAATESSGSARIAVTRSGNTTGTASVAYSTASGTATSSDYTPRSGTLVFLPGETEARFDLPIARDSRAEPTETVRLTLSAPSGGASLGTPATATLNILDSRPPDRTAPRLLLAPDSRSVRLGRLLRRGLRGAWSSTEAATAAFELRLRGTRTVLGNAAGSLSGGGARRFNVRVSRAGRSYLRRRLKRVKRVKLSLVLRATDRAGNRRTATVKLQVTR